MREPDNSDSAQRCEFASLQASMTTEQPVILVDDKGLGDAELQDVRS